MKAKLFVFIGLVVAAIGVSLVFNTTPVHAAGETYRWVNEDTIEASGGSFENMYADGKVTFSRDEGFSISVENLCVDREPFIITISPSQSNRNGSLSTSDCEFVSLDPEAYELDIAFPIANPERGPELPGSDIDFMELDCSTFVNRPDLGENFDQERWRCEAMQACIESGSSQTDCLTTWVGCVDERSNSFSCRNDMVENGTNIDLDGEEEEDENATTCAVDGLGWIICPILNFTANIADGSYGIVAGFLEVQPLLTTGTSEPIYQAWSIMRNIANVAFVIAFMIIIFSQITSFGISNYGIKKMLPRLIVAAILVNISYWVCAIAVDVTNILGGSIKQVFDSVGASFEAPNFGGDQTASTWSNITIGVLSAGIVVAASLYFTLSALIPILITVVAALISTLLILAIRQALIILLVVISPLAFVAFLLPNTQNLFSKWRGLFQTLLLMFPIIAAIFGASALASQVVTASAAGIDDDALRVVTQIFGAGIASIPLLLTILIPKLAGRLGSLVGANDPSKGLFDRARKGAEGYRDYRQNIAAKRRMDGTNMLRATSERWGGSKRGFVRKAGGAMGKAATVAGKTGFSSAASFAEGKKLEMEQRRSNAEKALAEAKQDYVAERAQNEDYAKRIAGPTGNVERIQAAAITAQKNAITEAIKNAEISANIKPGDLGAMAEMLKEAIKGGNTVKAQAMQNMMMSSGGKGISKYRGAMQDMENELARQGERLDYGSGVGADLRENMLKNHGGVKKDAADLIAQAANGLDLNQVSNDRSTWQMSAQDFVKQKDASIEIALDNNALGQEQAQRITSNKNLAGELSEENLARIESIARGIVQGSGGGSPPAP